MEQERYHEWIKRKFKELREEEQINQRTKASENIKRDELAPDRQNLVGHDFAVGWEEQGSSIRTRFQSF